MEFIISLYSLLISDEICTIQIKRLDNEEEVFRKRIWGFT
jgi:hypothetical protein